MHRIAALLFVASVADARPEFHAKFLNDLYRIQSIEGCATCHENPEGGGPRNDFGMAFDDANRTITPLLRAEFPDRFGFYSTQLADGTAFHFADPEGHVVVYEKGDELYAIDLVAITKNPEEVLPPPRNRMSFFVTSVGPGEGAHFEGLAGADLHCQSLAEAVGSTGQTWRAYLSTTYRGRPAVNAGDRIGTGPWFNASRIMVARGQVDLHRDESLLKNELVLTETGESVSGDVLTGTEPDGTAAIDANCMNWTSAAKGSAATGNPLRRWNAGGEPASCNFAEPRFYCFAKQD